MPSPVQDLTGLKFNRLTAIDYVPRYKWRCRCDCGRITTVQSGHLKSGQTKSCGCAALDVVRSRPKHGQWGGLEYWCWAGMIQRCENPRASGYADYGGRGIKVCERWKKFELFLADMGPRPGMQYSIDRQDVDGDYEPSNCRWATAGEQARNSRRTRLYELDGERLCIRDWSIRSGVHYDTLWHRLTRQGMTIQQALESTCRS